MLDNESLGSIEYRLPHLEDHALNEETLSRIQANDPSVEYLTYTEDDDSEFWIAGTGRAIGDSGALRMLKVWCYCFGCNALQDLDDFCLGLQHNRSIECLFLRTDFTFPSGPDIIQVIAPFFQHNRKLKFVDLEIDVQTWVASSVFGSLLSTLSKCKNNQLQCFRISSTNFTDDDTASLIDLLRIQQTNLLELALGDNIGRLGARALANLLNYSESKIRTLELQYHHLDVEGATILGAALVTNKTVKKLTFGEAIMSTPGLAAVRGFAQCLRHPSSAIEELYFTDCIYEIECMREIVTAIAHNRSLKVLEISFYGRVEWDWTCFSTILCNAMSIESTYSSNHTLICARIGNEWLCDDEDSYRYLILNRDDDNKAAVARQKILITHFTGGGSDVHAFTRLPETAMPHAISWIGRDYQGYSLMLNFVRGFPSLFGRNNSDELNRHAGVKRKQY